MSNPEPLLRPSTIHALATGTATMPQVHQLLSQMATIVGWRADECRELGCWADAEECDLTVAAIRAEVPAPDPAQRHLFAAGGNGVLTPADMHDAVTRILRGQLPPVSVAR